MCVRVCMWAGVGASVCEGRSACEGRECVCMRGVALTTPTCEDFVLIPGLELRYRLIANISSEFPWERSVRSRLAARNSVTDWFSL